MAAVRVLDTLSFLEKMKEGYHTCCSQVSSINDIDLFSCKVRELSCQNMAYIKALILEKIQELNNSLSSIAIALTGSDARFEKGGFSSKSELVVITAAPEESLPPDAQLSLAKIRELVASNLSFFFEMVEKKQVRAAEQVSVCVGRKNVFAPTRAFDAQFIAGNTELFVEYKKQLYVELKSDPAILKSFKKDFLKEAEKTLSLEWRAIQSPTKKSPVKPSSKLLGVDVSRGLVQTDGEYVKGPKYGVLRTIQYSVAYKIFCSPLSQADFMQVPSSILERIDWLRNKNLSGLTGEECDQLKHYYKLGSLWYSRLQDEVSLHGEATKQHTVSISVDSGLLRTVVTKTRELVSKMQQKQVCPEAEVTVPKDSSSSKKRKIHK